MMKIPCGGDVVDCPTQLICISDIYVNRQIQKTYQGNDDDGKKDDEEDVDPIRKIKRKEIKSTFQLGIKKLCSSNICVILVHGSQISANSI